MEIPPMHLVIVTDAWHPQVNGVVRTLDRTRAELEAMGHRVSMITPEGMKTIAMPSYPEIPLALFPGRRVRNQLDNLKADAVHIATEGPLGLAARAWCVKRQHPFTTSFHTQFPEYIWLRWRVPLAMTYALMRWFHGPASCVMTATASLRQRLSHWGFKRLGEWTRGVDTQLFQPYGPEGAPAGAARPIFLYAGRVAVEKNLEAFLDLDLPGSKVVVGAGPDLERLKTKYPQAHFTGYKADESLARLVASADVFIFPSKTDTFGLVLLEALACGVPVAAYPVQGPVDVIEEGVSGALDEDLRAAALRALELDRAACRDVALRYSWTACTRQFLSHLADQSATEEPSGQSAGSQAHAQAAGG
jgi:glycosyltransferase involved in cell wall biosynthesis